MAVKIRKDDMVVIIAGNGARKKTDDQGKKVKRTGRVLQVDKKNGRVIVEGINMRKHFTKVRQTKDGQAGGIETREAPISISNVALLDPKTQKAARVAIRKNADGTRSRITKGKNASGTVVE
ncbi:MAG TPA: 50S ribosomal protein L24 [Candidatus Sumerlaeota bacterium]|nr:50S ribosomal protein L24 [Candidatus Sumerlaeota bacterium]HMZ51655.1 50S ribosomal protein L24 [Candidatus Sumerlaeota bacterium]HNM46592.1 50S ribosomal protein L24 [Candidatus Sumerlaeota bacterium]